MRCFLAAWPDAETRRRCAALVDAVRAHAVHGRTMRPENLHLTLAFIGELPDDAGARVAGECRRLPDVACDWQLDAIGWFVRPRVLYAGGALTPALARVADTARGLLDRMGIGYDRKPFVPHVTLLRDVKRYDGPRTVEPPIAWPIGAIALYRAGRDEAGARYVRVEPA